MIHSGVAHQAFAALVSPAHDLADRLGGLGDHVQQGDKLYLEKLDEVFVAAVAYQGRLIANGFKVDFRPRLAHLNELLLIGKNSVESLSDLIDVQEAHWK